MNIKELFICLIFIFQPCLYAKKYSLFYPAPPVIGGTIGGLCGFFTGFLHYNQKVNAYENLPEDEQLKTGKPSLNLFITMHTLAGTFLGTGAGAGYNFYYFSPYMIKKRKEDRKKYNKQKTLKREKKKEIKEGMAKFNDFAQEMTDKLCQKILKDNEKKLKQLQNLGVHESIKEKLEKAKINTETIQGNKVDDILNKALIQKATAEILNPLRDEKKKKIDKNRNLKHLSEEEKKEIVDKEIKELEAQINYQIPIIQKDFKRKFAPGDASCLFCRTAAKIQRIIKPDITIQNQAQRLNCGCTILNMCSQNQFHGERFINSRCPQCTKEVSGRRWF